MPRKNITTTPKKPAAVKSSSDAEVQLKRFEEMRTNAKTPEELEKATFWIKHYKEILNKENQK